MRRIPQLGAGGGGAPIPNFVVANTSTAGLTMTLAGIVAGDLVIFGMFGNTQFTAGAAGYNPIISAQPVGGAGPPWLNVYTHVVTPQDTTTLTYLTAFPNFGSVVGIAFRGVFPATDGFGTLHDNAATQTLVSNSFTTTILGDVGIWIVLLQGSTNDIVSPPAGFTQNANAHVAASATFQGGAVAYNLNLGASGARTPGNATSSLAAGSGGTIAFALQP